MTFYRFAYGTTAISTLIALAAVVVNGTGAIAEGLASEKAMTMELTKPGFALVSDVVREDFLGALTNAPLPDQEISIPLISRVKAEGITFTVKLKTLETYPADGMVGVDALIDDVEVDISSLRFESWLVPFFGSTCTGAKIHVGNGDDLPVSTLLDANVANDKLALAVHSLDFSMDRSQYRSDGPADCRGLFNIRDYFTRFVVRSVLANARPAIELGVRVAARLIVPKVATELNKLATTPLVVDLPSLLVVPATSVKITGAPVALVLSADSMKIGLKASIEPARHGKDLPVSGAKRASHASGTVYGTFGLDPSFITEALKTFLAQGSAPLELKPEMDPMIDAITQRDSLAAFWPDLSLTRGIGERLRVFAKLGQAPVFSMITDGSGWHLSIPDAQLIYKIDQGGSWGGYTTLHLQAELDVAPEVANGQVVLKVLGGTAVSTSEWAPGYTPADATFDKVTADQVWEAAIQMMAGSTTPPHFALPILPLAGRNVGLDDLRQEGGFLTFDLIDAAP